MTNTDTGNIKNKFILNILNNLVFAKFQEKYWLKISVVGALLWIIT